MKNFVLATVHLVLSSALIFEVSIAKELGRALADGGILQEQDKQALLDAHNLYRSKTALGNTPNQPMAQNMKKLIWDDNLATDAKAYANRCVFRHDPNNEDQGENLYTAASTNDNVDNIEKLLQGLNGFYEEYRFYNYNSGGCTRVCGHYTQMVWGDTAKVGCGYAVCSDIHVFGPRLTYQILLVCRYSPFGNYYGRKPYTRANNKNAVASTCGDGYTGNKATGLCELKGSQNQTPILDSMEPPQSSPTLLSNSNLQWQPSKNDSPAPKPKPKPKPTPIPVAPPTLKPISTTISVEKPTKESKPKNKPASKPGKTPSLDNLIASNSNLLIPVPGVPRSSNVHEEDLFAMTPAPTIFQTHKSDKTKKDKDKNKGNKKM